MTTTYFQKNETIAQTILDGVIAAFKATDHPLPTRRVLGYAGMPLDCEMLAVEVVRMYQVDQGTGPEGEGVAAQRCVYWAGSDVDVILIRCAPQPAVVGNDLRPVAAAELTAFSKLTMADPHIIARGILNVFQAGQLGVGANIAFGSSEPTGDESGALVGIRVHVRVGNFI